MHARISLALACYFWAAPTFGQSPETTEDLLASCLSGNGAHCEAAGSRYSFGGELGGGVERDYDVAYNAFERGCDLGQSGSCNGLSMMYFHGRGRPVDLQAALQYAEKACELGGEIQCVWIEEGRFE